MAAEIEPQAPPDVSRLRISRREETRREPGRRGPVLIALVAGVVLLGSALAYWKFAAAGRPLEVTTARVQTPDVGGGGGAVLTASGYIIARRKAGVGPKTAGLLEYLGVEEGSVVEEGQVIGRLQHADVDAEAASARAAVEEARANQIESEALLSQARREFERARALSANGVISAAEFDLAESRLRSQEARLGSQRAAVTSAAARARRAEVAVEDTRVRAPFGGTILTKDAEEGETVAPAAAGRPSSRGSIVTMADLATLEAEVDVNESSIARLAADQPARIVADSFPGQVYQGSIRQIIPTADRQKATVKVKVSILEPGGLLRPDMGVKVTFLESGAAAAPARPLPRVPAAAVVTAPDGGRRAWVVENETARLVRIELGKEEAGFIEIRSGLSGGETVVIDPPRELEEGRRVRVHS